MISKVFHKGSINFRYYLSKHWVLMCVLGMTLYLRFSKVISYLRFVAPLSNNFAFFIKYF